LLNCLVAIVLISPYLLAAAGLVYSGRLMLAI
jgi:hypothetical protein